MMVGKDDLGLSLSLGSPENQRLQLNLMPSGRHQQHLLLPHRNPWIDLIASSSERGFSDPAAAAVARPVMLRGIDVNRAPTADRESEEEAGTSSPNSTLSSVCGKRDLAQISGGGGGGGGGGGAEEIDMERASSRGISDEEDGDGSRKKLRLSKDQSAILEESFKEHNTHNPKQKLALAKQLNLRPRQVEVWFQNRRARTKLKQTEVDCEFLKRCCENLTEENRRLQKEVAELRALKMSPQFYMQMTPPTTLTMCPSCERVAVSSAAAGKAAPPRDRHFLPQNLHRQTSAAPWAPVPLRPAFMDAVNPQRS